MFGATGAIGKALVEVGSPSPEPHTCCSHAADACPRAPCGAPPQTLLETLPDAKIVGVAGDPDACKALEREFGGVVCEARDAGDPEQVRPAAGGACWLRGASELECPRVPAGCCAVAAACDR